MNGYNPMLDYQRNQLLAQQAMIQNQLNQMGQGTPQMQFNPYPQQANQPQFFVRQVGSIDEAKSFPVDPSTIYFFLDTGTGNIYMKRLNTSNGKSDFFTYMVRENGEEAKVDPIEEINKRLSNIESIIGGIYDKPIPGNANGAEPDTIDVEPNTGKNEKSESAKIRADSTDGKRKG